MDKFIFRNEKEFTGFGNDISEARSAEEAVRLSGLEWNVVQRQLKNPSTGEEIPVYGNFRKEDNRFLGVVTNRYKVYQNSETFSVADQLYAEGLRFSVGGACYGGRKVWMMMTLPNKRIGKDEFQSNILLLNSFDGSTALRYVMTPVRIVCSNAMNMALSKAENRWTFSHMGDMAAKVRQAEITSFKANAYMDALEEAMYKVMDIPVSINGVQEMAELLIKPSSSSERAAKNAEKRRNELLNIFLYSADLQHVGNNAYRFINAVTDFEQHSMNTRNYEKKFLDTVNGGSLAKKAWELLTNTL